MAKRGNGEGSIYQRSSDDRWVGAYTATDGRRRVIYGNTRSEVRDRLVVVQREALQGIAQTPARLTVEAFLDQWLDAVKPSLRPRTFASYSDLLRLHVRPRIGKVALAKLTPRDVQSLVNDRLAAGLSPRTVQYVHAVLRRALGHAEKWGLVSRNVARLVDGPRVRRAEIHPLTPDEARQLLASVRGSRDEALYTVAIAMGLRQGEALALRWSDVDLDAGALTVRHTLQRLDRKAELMEPKTPKSRRTLSMPAPVLTALRDHRRRQLEERLAMGEDWQDLDFVFASGIGTPLDASAVTHRYQRTLLAAGLPRQRFHDTRHACASFLLAQGVPLRVVQEILGHSRISTTADVYAHVLPTLQKDAADRMGELLSSSR
ncbi:MAG: tyrosine-type recombinase/integrase [Candidatus Limnocylindrales bacterium]|jgi:integrase